MLFDPIIECVYGWGQVMRLYDDRLDIGGTSYPLMDLVAVHPNYYHVLGVPSARIELCFRHKRVILRGIATIETAQRTASYLKSFCHLQNSETDIPLIDKNHVAQSQWLTGVTKEKHQTDEVLQYEKVQQAERITDAVECTHTTDDYSEGGRHKVLRFKIPHWQLIGREQRQRRMKRIRSERSKREHGFDVEQLAQRLQEEDLPSVYVPTRLLADECALYCTNATLCEEPATSIKQSGYRVKDQGMLILTDRRMIYIGRRRQLVLDYSRLMHVSRLQGAIAVLSESWAKREIFEVRLPLECTMYLDAILLRYRKGSVNERTHARVRQLYPSTKTSSFERRTNTHTTQAEALAQWHSADPSSK